MPIYLALMNWKTILGCILTIASAFSFINLHAQKANGMVTHHAMHSNALSVCAVVMIIGVVLVISGVRNSDSIRTLLTGALPLNTLGDEDQDK